MLSDREKRDLLEMAASAEVQADFRRLSEPMRDAMRNVDLDRLIRWLTAMSRAAGPVERPLPVEFRNPLL